MDLRRDRLELQRVELRRAFALLMMFALLLAPTAVDARQTVSSADHAQMMERPGHCAMQPGAVDQDRAPVKSCCLSVSIGLPAEAPATLAPMVVAAAPAIANMLPAQLGADSSIETPPPRHS